ncbi:MAG: bifunctional 2-polyprenyl-6-hydroxyphenol methylase/3-demethylubiquinol 3-O-methyltransferase UbiG [Aphanocapsa sp. GSE-SYN-MK-11-07L]|jgi:2-polyprenyl-6-hydroxyphenyl methylase/3-demethylubiquinone-9 3-methyltransferase|nr:bifunctional 2-polyprenyl-6-hydroxyphenol methylase/3-demethylubiquinol 3-O-methyltransferase UbiG [Aphanocapsa sp. GSE-SYN-MK-11-07L]
MKSKKPNDLSLYDKNASSWWNPEAKFYALNYLNPLRFKFFDQHIEHWKTLNVLDVGCGGGFTCEYLAARGANVFGIDQSAECIAVASNHSKTSDFHIEYKLGYSESLPYPDSFFDVVVCVDVLEHVASLEKSLLQIQRVLKSGGFFFFDTINKTIKSRVIMIWLLEMILKEIPCGIHDWNKFISPSHLESLLVDNNFSNIEISGFHVLGTTLWEHFLAYRQYKKSGDFSVKFDADTSLMYIGAAKKI